MNKIWDLSGLFRKNLIKNCSADISKYPILCFLVQLYIVPGAVWPLGLFCKHAMSLVTLSIYLLFQTLRNVWAIRVRMAVPVLMVMIPILVTV